jgi:hypothetical protein
VLNLLEFGAAGANDRSEAADGAAYWNLGIWFETWNVDQLDKLKRRERNAEYSN